MAIKDKVGTNNPQLPQAQYLIYFFIPLPENLGVPNDFFVPISADHAHRRPGVEFIHIEDIEFAIEYSIVFRQTEHPANTEGFEAALTAAEHYIKLPGVPTPKNLEIEGQTTVAEVMCVISEHTEQEAARVFTQAIKHVNDFINAYYVVEHQPKRLVSLATLPPMIPFVNRTITAKSQPNVADGELGLYAVNLSKTGVANAKDETLPLEKLQVLPTALERTVGGLLDVFNDIQREADIARREGNTVTTSILLESAAEVLLRETLLFLHWEEGKAPADAAWVVRTHDLNDILDSLEAKLAGNWSRSKAGAVKNWTVNVALLRDKTVHAGYRPTNEEIILAYDSLRGLIKYVADRISHNWQQYTLAADNIVGAPSVEKRLKEKMAQFQELMNELHNPISVAAQFGRWKYEVERSLKGKKAWSSHHDSCRVVLLLYPNGKKLWWLVDYNKRLARRAKEPILKPGIQATLDTFLKDNKKITAPRSVLLEDTRAKPLSGGSHWYELHKILPLFEIDRWAKNYHVYMHHNSLY